MTDTALLQKIRDLPPEKRQKVSEFIDSLCEGIPTGASSGFFFGAWSDLEIDLTEEDLDEARREMWRGFPRDDVS